jgi:hypothetical protein
LFCAGVLIARFGFELAAKDADYLFWRSGRMFYVRYGVLNLLSRTVKNWE